jgi:tRNA-uridine 2-sulfurtransferase
MQIPSKKERVVVAMSGGVDSSVCAYLLKEKGYDVIGVTIKTWTNDECKDEKSKGCCSIRDIDDARSVARKLDIPYYVMDLSSDFKTTVIDNFVDEYLAGRTPNPCIECNRHIKFGILLEKAKELDAAYVATGHYAQKGYDETQNRYFIEEGVDLSKDQSYVLFGLNQEQLSKVLLPVGEMKKTAVREIAEKLGLRVFDKPDSQEICFVKKDYGDFVKQYAPERLPGQGAFVNKKGEVVGTHEGSHLFTIGQRKRIQITDATPYFVTAINAERNEVEIGKDEDLLSQTMTVRRVNWLLNPQMGPVAAKIRSRHEKAGAEIVEINSDRVKIKFHEAQKAVTPGQSAVFYDGARVIGGGWIDS